MVDIPRKKSPRSPSISLEDALNRVMKVYDRERLHPAPTDVVVQHLGYKSANNGSAMSALASLRYFAVLERPKDGMYSVAREVESYRFAPDENLKRELLLRFLKSPPLYNDLLNKYSSGLPSDANLKFELIQRGFAPQAAESALAIFKESINFANYYAESSSDDWDSDNEILNDSVEDSPNNLSQPQQSVSRVSINPVVEQKDDGENEMDRIPIRLPGGRRAWLIIPSIFYEDDKARLKAQIDLLLTVEEDER